MLPLSYTNNECFHSTLKKLADPRNNKKILVRNSGDFAIGTRFEIFLEKLKGLFWGIDHAKKEWVEHQFMEFLIFGAEKHWLKAADLPEIQKVANSLLSTQNTGDSKLLNDLISEISKNLLNDYFCQNSKNYHSISTSFSSLHRKSLKSYQEIINKMIRVKDLVLQRDYEEHTIYTAIASGNLSALGWLSRSPQFNPNCVDEKGKTPLLYAIKHKQIKIVEFLLDQGAGINDRAEDRLAPLSYASCKGHTDIAKLLIHSGADLHIQSTLKRTPLSHAAYYGRTDIAKLLIEAGADIDHLGEPDSMTPLAYAAMQGHKEIAQLLIDAGANIHLPDKSNRTPLFYAVVAGHEDIAKLLIISGANVNHLDKEGSSPLLWSAWSFLGEKNLQIVKLLIDSGADIDLSNEPKKMTTLAYASSNGYLEVAKLLIDAGANIDAQDKTGETPLVNAVLNNHADIAKLLIDAGADVNHKDQEKVPVLIYAMLPENLDIVKLLIDAGANVNCENGVGRTPIFFSKGDVEVFRSLINAGADIDHKDKEGQNFLELAKWVHPNYKKMAEIRQTYPEHAIFGEEGVARTFIAHLAHLKGTTKIFHKQTKKIHEKKIEGSIRNYFWKKLAKGTDLFIKEISSGNQEALKTLKETFFFSHNTMDSEKIYERYLSGQPIFLSTGFFGHAIGMLILKNQMLILNRWASEDDRCSSFKFNPDCLTKQIIQEIGEGFKKEEQKGLKFLYDWLPKTLEATQNSISECLNRLKLPRQKVRNCGWINAEGLAFYFLILSEFQNYSELTLTPEISSNIVNTQKNVYHDWLSYQKVHGLWKYLRRVEKNIDIIIPDFRLLVSALIELRPHLHRDSRIIQKWEEAEKLFLKIAPYYVRGLYHFHKKFVKNGS